MIDTCAHAAPVMQYQALPSGSTWYARSPSSPGPVANILTGREGAARPTKLKPRNTSLVRSQRARNGA
jgi:hypothetical protein